ncbi:hypothetical protein OU5_5028 [Pseudomonas mandelii JR-1]|uniref:DUF4145 domain-containing protein n=1 Tax=Pseudomonas mandelii JR-1 TaxID=1147786 RepID=A0A024EH14_9PSED|nr:DUF4145 domain-containing protein [Pseudomonas mandelii]AHZ72107.1 hypothetical protein OU5_5028 [Pseudomonas mandelii JR-1]OYQ04458.1 DUF4145 domain-containing protein [Pseudomonas mandelii]
MTVLIGKRFTELENQLEVLLNNATLKRNDYDGTSELYISPDLILNWNVKAKSLMARVCGANSTHLKMYADADVQGMYESYVDRLNRLKAIFLAAKEDFEGGHLNTIRNLVQAEVFTSELEQAEELLKAGYATAAAVIAGVVLETTLRDLCSVHDLEHGSLNKMNDDLAKVGAYNATQKKRITALAAIRNSAAHGKPEEFTAAEVKGMIDDVERLLTTTLQ